MRTLVQSFALVSSLFLMGCGSGDVCALRSKCSAQPAPTAAEISACQTATASGAKCRDQFITLTNCSSSKEVCGSDNRTDAVATVAACATESSAYATCIAAP